VGVNGFIHRIKQRPHSKNRSQKNQLKNSRPKKTTQALKAEVAFLLILKSLKTKLSLV
jgi:hypothetical protein